jgi:hypothetical protein
MKIRLFIFSALLLVGNINFVLGAHYIVGYVENAKDGESANGKSVLLWNPLNGMLDNVSDIVGVGGNSGADNIYMIDCEMLSSPCNVGDILSLKIVNGGDDYVSAIKNVSVTGFGYSLVNNLSLNSPPTANLTSPYQNQIFNSSTISFNCSGEDLDSNLETISLWGNWTGTWQENETKSVSGGQSEVSFEKEINDGFYSYSCIVKDDLGIENKNKENISFVVDIAPPEINYISLNESYSCGEITIRVSCETFDETSGIKNVTIKSIAPSYNETYNTNYFGGNVYYSDIEIDEIGDWNFICTSEDFAGNKNYIESEKFDSYFEGVDLFVEEEIVFLTENPIENVFSIIGANITNKGCSASDNFSVGFYEDSLGTKIGEKNISLSGLDSKFVNISWNTKIGPTNFFVFADSNEGISENNESNNIANKTFHINSWQVFYGNVSLNKILGNEGMENISIWFDEEILVGNLFVTAKSGTIDWLGLQAVGRTQTGEESIWDFQLIDNLLGMENFNDSVSSVFSENQIPKTLTTILAYGKTIDNVPIINSTNNSNFITGLLWDTSKDTNNYFDSGDREDIVFVSKLNKQKQGFYGVYDYEIRIPVKLREYYDSYESEIYFYYELE